MSQADAFLHAILAAPDDDAPRLLYADWLEERGDYDRAEFIRVQCELARGGSDDERRRSLERRQENLLALHGCGWAGLPLAKWGWYSWQVKFRRGFVEVINLEYPEFVKHAEALLRTQPTIRHATVRLTCYEERSLEALTALPCLERLVGLTIDSGLSTYGDSPDHPIDQEGFQALAAALPRLVNLRTLCLSQTALDDEAVAVLATSPYLIRLTELDLSCNDIGAEGARALAASPGVAGLSELNLSGNDIGAEGAVALAKSPHLAGLTKLNVWNCWSFFPPPEGAVALLKQRFGERVKV